MIIECQRRKEKVSHKVDEIKTYPGVDPVCSNYCCSSLTSIGFIFLATRQSHELLTNGTICDPENVPREQLLMADLLSVIPANAI